MAAQTLSPFGDSLYDFFPARRFVSRENERFVLSADMSMSLPCGFRSSSLRRWILGLESAAFVLVVMASRARGWWIELWHYNGIERGVFCLEKYRRSTSLISPFLAKSRKKKKYPILCIVDDEPKARSSSSPADPRFLLDSLHCRSQTFKVRS